MTTVFLLAGKIILSAPLDRETTAEYQLVVQATDAASSLSDFAALVISVADVNDFTPVIQQSLYEVCDTQTPVIKPMIRPPADAVDERLISDRRGNYPAPSGG